MVYQRKLGQRGIKCPALLTYLFHSGLYLQQLCYFLLLIDNCNTVVGLGRMADVKYHTVNGIAIGRGLMNVEYQEDEQATGFLYCSF